MGEAGVEEEDGETSERETERWRGVDNMEQTGRKGVKGVKRAGKKRALCAREIIRDGESDREGEREGRRRRA